MKPNEMRALAHAGMAAAVFVVLSTIASELSPPFKAFLVSIFSHHWIAKSVLSIVVFAIAYYWQKDRVSSAKVDLLALAWRVAAVAVLSGAVIFVFFLWEFFKG